MSKLENKLEPDELDRLLENWSEELPEPPALLVDKTLSQLRHSKRPSPPQNWPRLVLLGGMAAASVLIIAGLLVVLSIAGKPETQPVPVAALPTSTATLVPATATFPAEIATATPLPPSPTAVPTTTTSASIAVNSQADATSTVEVTATVTATAESTSGGVANGEAQNPSSPSSTPAITLPPDVNRVNPVLPVKPTSGGAPIAPTSRPTLAPTSTSTPVPPQPAQSANSTRLSGQITALDATGFSLTSSPERILFLPTTKFFSGNTPVNRSTLQIGQTVTVQTSRNQQGQLVAEVISIVPKPSVPPGPPRPPIE